MQVIYHPEGLAELEEITAYLESKSSGLGQRFILELDAMISQLTRHPLRWRRVRGEIRKGWLKVFPYDICYLPREASISVEAVVHQKRHPKYWLERYED